MGIRTNLVIVFVSFFVMLGIVGVGASLLGTPSTAADYWHRLPACTSDDGGLPAGATLCYWDAKTMGNGVGRSFISDGTNVTYVR